MTWDIKMGVFKPGGPNTRPIYRIHMPVDLSELMLEAGFNRAKLTLSEDGIIVRPYRAEKKTVLDELPAWIRGEEEK